MSKVYVLLADGFEEIEGLTVVDLLRRAGIEVVLASIKDTTDIKGARGINVVADELLSDIKDSADMVVLPGGMPGTNYLKESQAVRDMVQSYYDNGKYIAAICAAPTVFGRAGLLEGKKATCYPGMEGDLKGAIVSTEEVCHDGNIITSRGLGTAIAFALEIVKTFQGEEAARKLAHGTVYKR